MIYTTNQQEALDYRGGNLLIIACAGSGKTQVLSRRIALLVSEGVPKESIIAFTFTDMAAGELKSRIRKQIGAVLQALLELVIEQPEYNTKEILLEQSRKLREETLL